MAPERAPAFQFYADKFLLDEHQALMTLAQAGAYVRLMAYCWREQTIPDDPDACRILVNDGRVTLKQFREMWPLIRACFETSEPGRLVHPTLERERVKQAAWRAKCSEGGKKGSRKGGSKGSSTTPATPLEVNANSLVSNYVCTPQPPASGGRKPTRAERKLAEKTGANLGDSWRANCHHTPECNSLDWHRVLVAREAEAEKASA